MPVKRVLVREGADLLAQGYSYIDVRSVPEFQAGHPAGAYNIPIVHIVPGRGRMPNMDFAAVVEKHFPRDAKLLLGCGSGPRSLRAAELLQQAGWTDVVDLRPGFEGERDMGGRVVNPGWRDAGLPVETAAPGRTWDELSK